MSDFENRVLAWNRERGLLESFDPNLSMRLLCEEAKEFFNAESLVDMLCEYADFHFVLEGYRSIRSCSPLSSVSLPSTVKGIEALESWCLATDNHMLHILRSRYGRDYFSRMENDIEAAKMAVCICNEQKSSEKKEGKIVKAANQRKPQTLICTYLHRGVANSDLSWEEWKAL